MQKILSKEILLEKTFNELKDWKQFETYTFEEKKQYLKCLREIKFEYKQLHDKIIAQNLDQTVLADDPNIKIKDKIELLKSVLRDL